MFDQKVEDGKAYRRGKNGFKGRLILYVICHRSMSAISTAEVAGFYDPMAYIFLGDYVDRGRRSLECVCLVLTLKILFPRKYQILRGNHECKGINRVYGFYDELFDRFEKEEAERLWLGFNEVFAWMPLAGLVGKKILCMHGGISAYLNSLDDIRMVLIVFFHRYLHLQAITF
ncbi:hypothetical protein KIN20_022959 [Parelaphostrongylus tenuis]|uniref:Serine/threonine-protein phosphatase n=1 Tax=Parelaphostrongylus tenuis TaxID=148309 RepID=A0AAD5QSN0_PARTN|nr:hypothetical protein KIN20_022959 [Parelaphostrongylus tenuis]